MPSLIRREQVAEQFEVSTAVLYRYEARGLVQVVHEGQSEGYGPAEVRRIWTILSLQRDLGINLAGVEAILRLRSHLDEVHRHVRLLADELRSALDDREQEAPDG